MNVTKEQVVAGFDALSRAVERHDETEIKKQSIIVNDLLTKAEPAVLEELQPKKLHLDEIAETAITFIKSAQKLWSFIQRWKAGI